MKIPFTWIIIAALVLIIVLQRACTPEVKPVQIAGKSDTTYVHIHDTIREVKLIPITKIVEHRPAPITISDTVFLPETAVVDTANILKDYFATRNYSDTNEIAYGNFIIQDAITQNKVKTRVIAYNLSIPEIKQTLITPQKNQVYLGLDIGGTKDWISFGPQFTLKTKTDKMYHLGASYTTQNQFYFHVGTDWKIHL